MAGNEGGVDNEEGVVVEGEEEDFSGPMPCVHDPIMHRLHTHKTWTSKLINTFLTSHFLTLVQLSALLHPTPSQL